MSTDPNSWTAHDHRAEALRLDEEGVAWSAPGASSTDQLKADRAQARAQLHATLAVAAAIGENQ